jgi:alanyl aminopeptidase
VTTAWWDDIWLNEAFATWIAEKIVDRWRPDYHRGARRVDERAQAIEADALASARRIRQPVDTRGDVNNAFDSITYQKGATVIGMFEAWIGEEPFRLGVKNYLEARRNGSATSADFLDALTKASLRPVSAAFDTFLNQGGIPLVETRLSCGKDGARLELAQRRLTLVGAAASAPQRWQIPVCAKFGSATSSKSICTLLADASASIPLGNAVPGVRVRQRGGARVLRRELPRRRRSSASSEIGRRSRPPNSRACSTTSTRLCAPARRRTRRHGNGSATVLPAATAT